MQERRSQEGRQLAGRKEPYNEEPGIQMVSLATEGGKSALNINFRQTIIGILPGR